MQSQASETTFAPSELIVLQGEKFATPLKGGLKLLHLDQRVNSTELGRAVLAAAVLANEQQGTIRLGIVHEWKAVFGLLKGKKADGVEPGTANVAWPEHSLEARVRPLVEQLSAKKKNTEFDLFCELLGDQTESPWVHAVGLVENGLLRRGLMGVKQKTTLKIFKRSEFVLPESTRDLAATKSVDSIQQLIRDCQQSRPEVWTMLTAEMDRAIRNRTETDDDGPDFDTD